MLKNLSTSRKVLLIAGLVMLLFSMLIVWPIERSQTSFLEELGYTFLTLALALILFMIGLLGRHFFRGLLFLICSMLVGGSHYILDLPFFHLTVFLPSG